MTATLHITQTTAFKTFALDFLRQEPEQKSVVLTELNAYAKRWIALLADGSDLDNFESSIMSINFDSYISNMCDIDDLYKVIHEFSRIED